MYPRQQGLKPKWASVHRWFIFRFYDVSKTTRIETHYNNVDCVLNVSFYDVSKTTRIETCLMKLVPALVHKFL